MCKFDIPSTRIDDRSLSGLGTYSLITSGGVKHVKKVFDLKVQYNSPTWSKKGYTTVFMDFILSDKFLSQNKFYT